MHKIVLEEQAKTDITEAILWHERQKEKLGTYLLDEIQKTISQISENPLLFKKVAKGYRQAIINKFPYVIIYEHFENEVFIYRIFHTSRNPRYKYKK